MRKPNDKCRRIKLFLTDVDGVLTDAGMFYTEKGDEVKKFCTLDGGGLMLLKSVGLKTGFLTSESTRMVERRAQKLGVDFTLQGARNKLEALKGLLEETGLGPDEVAYIGDDINDIEVLQFVGVSATVPDHCLPADLELDYTTQRRGGQGAVRDFAEWLLKQRGEYDTALSKTMKSLSG
jgi:YrbI family 3-deoxy-D-manno-octulosonate 8-phosphate phosphatase